VDLDEILACTEGLWAELKGERLFITGGTGFVGCWLLESLVWANDALDLGVNTVVLTRRPDVFRQRMAHVACHPGIRLHQGDVRTFEFPTGTFSCVIHAASDFVSHRTSGEGRALFEAAVDGTRRTLSFVQQCGARKLLFVSSGAVYGDPPASMIDLSEDYAGGPDVASSSAAYGEAKRAEELLCILNGREHGFETKIARAFAFVGPYLRLDAPFAIGNFIRDRLDGGPIRVKGDGTPRRSYLYAADLAVWLWTILLRAPAERPYNVGSDEEVSIAGAARAVARADTPELAVVIERRTDLATTAMRYVPSVRRAQMELGLSRRVSLPEAIRRAVSWHQLDSVRAMGEG